MKLRIKETAKRNGLTMRKLAEISGIDTTTLSRYNTRTVDVPLSRLLEIASALNCEVAELLPVSGSYYHLEMSGEWLGIRKK